MLFRYEAFTNGGECFRFDAEDDEHAKRLMLQHITACPDKSYRAEIYKWDETIKKISHEHAMVVEIPQRAIDNAEEREISVTYIKYVNFKAHSTQREFEKLVDKELKRFDNVTPDKTWIRKKTQVNPVYGCTDDRYGVDEVEEINIDTTQ